MLQENLNNRLKMVTYLRDEVMGPCTNLDLHGVELNFDDSKRKWILPENLRRQCYVVIEDDKREVLGPDEPPIKRYGVGILYCREENLTDLEREDVSESDLTPEEIHGSKKKAESYEKELEKKVDKTPSLGDDDATSAEDNGALAGTNLRSPTTMGISFQVDPEANKELIIKLKCARYESLNYIGDQDPQPAWWMRSPISIEYRVPAVDLTGRKRISIKRNQIPEDDQKQLGPIDLELNIFSRPVNTSTSYQLITVCFVNRSVGETQENKNRLSLFQAEFEVISQGAGIVQYAEARHSNPSDEELSLELLYSNQPIFATGHGCSADWGDSDNENPFIRKVPKGTKSVERIYATSLPCHELENVSAAIESDGKKLSASMRKLGGLEQEDNGLDDLSSIVDGYNSWIAQKQGDITDLDVGLKSTAARHIGECKKAYGRMLEGIQLLNENEDARQAFQLANEAIYIQQKRAGNTRKWEGNPLTLSGNEEDFFKAEDKIGLWRPFQIAFILMNLKSTYDRKDPYNENVELIWFPTGGGKTEAYLGLAAFAIVLQRLQDPNDSGTQVLMRYTLRLLTSQQFQRASGLACALDHIRRRERGKKTIDLGESPISIGLWVGGSNTPNTNEDAKTALNQAKKTNQAYKFVLQRCPWCGAQMGPIPLNRDNNVVKGIVRIGNSIEFRCPDSSCEFSKELPVTVVDDQIYEKPPTILIGTVDKFASLAWRPEVRKIFGLNKNGERVKSPPSLIIQDELHLITGPLGTVCSSYEVIIEELCTDHRGESPIKPKIVSATATTRNYREQIKMLYSRDSASIFPPPGLTADDSYFASSEKDDNGKLTPGRIHVGMMATGYPSLQTASVRAFSSLLNTPSYLPDEQKDPWWTLLVFYNSIRELGGALTLFMGDIPERMAVMRRRLNRLLKISEDKFEYENARYLQQNRIKELTSRIRNDEVPKAIDDLEQTYEPKKTNKSYDVCLASSIIEVGVDIQRLAVMAIVGQPKTTAQYIQVAGRVGRDREKPGLVVTQYSPSKPRDRSHFERFITYHDRLYSMVEPASLTPFTPPAIKKTLTGVIAAYLRQTKDEAAANDPRNAIQYLDECFDLIRERCESVAPAEIAQVNLWLDNAESEMKKWRNDRWSHSNQMQQHRAQLFRSGSPKNEVYWKGRSWPTMNSMRSVDTECSAEICQHAVPEID